METQNQQQNNYFSLPAGGSAKKFNSRAFLKQLRVVRSLLTPEAIDDLKKNDRETKE